ncbi:MAG TPA: universal stress protein [Chitinophagaceae bacterium]|nr:universal stress protein [Chitinophagaceae bacterium]
MQTILVPTDFSDSAKNAMHYAASLAKKFNASIILLHAYMMPTPVSEVPYLMVNVEEMQKENERLAAEAAQAMQSGFGIKATAIVRLGFPSEEIEAIVEDQPIDLVVMGMKGQGTLEKLMGSTTTSTIKKIDIPIIVVPYNAQYQDIRQVTYATDFSYKTGFRVYQPMLRLVEAFGATLQIVHVQKSVSETKSREVAGEIQLDPAFKSVPHHYHTITDTDVKHGIKSFLEDHKTDLLVMVTHEHNFLERLFGRSQTTSMVQDTHIPLLILKDKK